MLQRYAIKEELAILQKRKMVGEIRVIAFLFEPYQTKKTGLSIDLFLYFKDLFPVLGVQRETQESGNS